MSNNSIIISLVEKHFSLEEESLDRFKERINNTFVDPIYSNLGLNDLRKKIKILPEEYEMFDEGWSLFKTLYSEFYEKYKISYDEFSSGLCEGTKLSKKIILFYRDTTSDLFYSIAEKNSRIGKKRLPKIKDLYIVLSINFADWFLCSTSEDWSSCIDLESTYQSSFWSGLPGLVIDKNRALFYLTDGVKKEYNGIKTDRFISRTWALLDKNDCINTIKEYPLSIISNILLKSKFGKVLEITPDFVSKYPLDFLYNKRGYSIFPYLDKSKIKKIRNEYYIAGSDIHGGLYGYDKLGSPYDGSPYNCEYGLGSLIEKDIEIDYFCGEQYSCEECGIGLTEDEVYFDKADHSYCEDCFYEQFYYCSNCGEVVRHESDEKMLKEDEKMLCKECLTI